MSCTTDQAESCPCWKCSAPVPVTDRASEYCPECRTQNCVPCMELRLDGEVGIHAMCGLCLSEYDDSRWADGGAL